MLCQVLKAGSSTWNDVFWNLRALGEAAREQFWEKAIHSNVNAFEELEAAKKLEIWKVTVAKSKFLTNPTQRFYQAVTYSWLGVGHRL